MKVFVKSTFQTSRLNILTIKFVDGIRIFVGDELFNESEPNLCFKVKYTPIGTLNLSDNSFDIGIEETDTSLEEFGNKEFTLKNETDRHTKEPGYKKNYENSCFR